LPVLPAGKKCALQYVNEYGRPPVGPNLYITPPGSFTWFHEDGHGTVDSGHQCLCGCNEVIMLKRMNAQKKNEALKILCGDSGYNLSTLPHDLETLQWPSNEQLQQLKEMGAMPAVFTLEPGEFVHINKVTTTSLLPDLYANVSRTILKPFFIDSSCSRCLI